jgi:hypothetical protein
MTLPPASVAGTAELIGPVQKPDGSGAGEVLAGGSVAGSAAAAIGAVKKRIAVAAKVSVAAKARVTDRQDGVLMVRFAAAASSKAPCNPFAETDLFAMPFGLRLQAPGAPLLFPATSLPLPGTSKL